METLLMGLEATTIAAAAMSIVYTIGIVWRTEHELDRSYTFFAFAIAFFLLHELSSLYVSDMMWLTVIEKASNAIFAILFLIGTLFMRDIVRKLDGEK